MRTTYTASITETPEGFLGQLIEWPDVLSAGKDLEECEANLEDALEQMILAYKESGMEIPTGAAILKHITAEV